MFGISPSTGSEPESSGEHVSPVSTTSSRASLSELNVTVHVLFSTGQLGAGGGGGARGHLAGLRLVD